MTGPGSRLIVVAPPELTAGYRLAGAAVREASDAAQAEAAIADLIASGEQGVIAVFAPLLAGMDAARRRRLEDSIAPVIVGLPAGAGSEEAATHRARLAALLQRAVGYHITFGEES